jgi:hypothetical protein
VCVHEYVSGLQVVSSACPGHDIFQLTNTGSGAAAAPDALVTKADILPERHTTVEETDQDAGGVGGTTGGGGGAFGDLVSGGRGGGGGDGANKTQASPMHTDAIIKMVSSLNDSGDITNQVIAALNSDAITQKEVYQNSENHDPNHQQTQRVPLTVQKPEKRKRPQNPKKKTSQKNKQAKPSVSVPNTFKPSPQNLQDKLPKPSKPSSQAPNTFKQSPENLQDQPPKFSSQANRMTTRSRVEYHAPAQKKKISCQRVVTLPAVCAKASRILGSDMKPAGFGLFIVEAAPQGTVVTEYGIVFLFFSV